MGIAIQKVAAAGAGDSDGVAAYVVTENGRQFGITVRSHFSGLSVSLTGEPGSLHIDSEHSSVYRQVVALGGGCGLLIDDVPVEGLSPQALRAVIGLHHQEATGRATPDSGQ